MKNQYVKPEMVLEEFLANKYCVNCSKDPSRKGVTINFKCNAGGGTSGLVWKESNNQSGLQSSGNNSDTKLVGSGTRYTSFSACNKDHTITVTGVSTIAEALATQKDMFEGWFRTSKQNDNQAISVYVWTANNTNVHCTTLKPEQWTLAKS